MANSQSFAIGDTVTITVTSYVADVLTDPTASTIIIEEPDGTDNTPTVSNTSTGINVYTFVPDQAGWHRFQVKGTGSAAFIKEGAFYVHTSGITVD